MVNTKFWDDNYVIKLDPTEKLLFLYFLTNPLTDASGVYEIAIKRVAFDTGIDQDMVSQILGRFGEGGKIFYLDGWIYIKNFSRHQVTNENMMKGVQRSLKQIPTKISAQIREIDEGFQRLYGGFESLSKGVVPKPELKPKPKPELKLSGTHSTRVEQEEEKNPTQEYSDTDLLPVENEAKEAGLTPVEPKEPKINYPIECCRYLTTKTEMEKLDKGLGANLKNAKLVLSFLQDTYGVSVEDAFKMTCQIIDFALQDSFHVQNMTSMVYVGSNLQRFIKQMQAKNQQLQKSEEYRI